MNSEVLQERSQVRQAINEKSPASRSFADYADTELLYLNHNRYVIRLKVVWHLNKIITHCAQQFNPKNFFLRYPPAQSSSIKHYSGCESPLMELNRVHIRPRTTENF